MPPTWDIVTISAVIGAVAALAGVIPTTVSFVQQLRTRRILEKDFGSELYTSEVIERSTRYYVPPDSSNVDPAGEAEIKNVRAPKEKLFDGLDDFLEKDSVYRHMLILADSGMGKTSCLLNYYARNQDRRRKRHRIALVPLGRPDADAYITDVKNKNQTIIFLDAFDEDTKAIDDHRTRLAELMDLCRDFKRVVITCRTQFFQRDEEIPKETGIARVGAVSAGENKAYEFLKVYLLPFDDKQISQYLRKRYPIWRWFTRRKARKLVYTVPLLSVRPMLLAYIPELMEREVTINSSFELYDALIEAWALREKPWAEPDKLKQFSELLAVDLYVNRSQRGSEYIALNEISLLADEWDIQLEQWKLGTRSLLNRDAVGNYKFAHRSILEYLFVKFYLASNDSWADIELTDLMLAFATEIIQKNALNQFGHNLQGLSLAGANLSGADLSKANLNGANLSGVNLTGANLNEAKLREVKFNSDTIWPSGFHYRLLLSWDWITIPDGEFLMGDDEEQHKIYLSDYKIAKTPVTNRQYKLFVDMTDHALPSHWVSGKIPQGKEDHPVVYVSWQDAMAFCQWANVRLPTEAEWEKAARGTDGRAYPWGNEAPDRELCNFEDNVGDTTPVDQYPKGASPYGVLDMAGNVWEWTSSLYKDYPYDADDGREDPKSAGPRTLRGGSFANYNSYVRCAARDAVSDLRDNYVGFRVVRHETAIEN